MDQAAVDVGRRLSMDGRHLKSEDAARTKAGIKPLEKAGVIRHPLKRRIRKNEVLAVGGAPTGEVRLYPVEGRVCRPGAFEHWGRVVEAGYRRGRPTLCEQGRAVTRPA